MCVGGSSVFPTHSLIRVDSAQAVGLPHIVLRGFERIKVRFKRSKNKRRNCVTKTVISKSEPLRFL